MATTTTNQPSSSSASRQRQEPGEDQFAAGDAVGQRQASRTTRTSRRPSRAPPLVRARPGGADDTTSWSAAQVGRLCAASTRRVRPRHRAPRRAAAASAHESTVGSRAGGSRRRPASDRAGPGGLEREGEVLGVVPGRRAARRAVPARARPAATKGSEPATALRGSRSGSSRETPGTWKSSPARAMHARSRMTTRRRGSGRAARSGRRAPAWTSSPSAAVPGGDLQVVQRLVQAAPDAVGGGRPCAPARPRGRPRAQSSVARPGWRRAGRVRARRARGAPTTGTAQVESVGLRRTSVGR